MIGGAPVAIDIEAFSNLVSADHGLAVISVDGGDGTVHSSVANVGVLPHPRTGETVAGFVAAGNARKLRLLRVHPRATVVLRGGWRWAGVEGPVELIGPDDPAEGIDAEAIRVLLRDVFTAAGGTHDDWDAYDRTMAAERRTAVLLTPARLYSPG